MKWLNKLIGTAILALASLTFSPKAKACSDALPAGRAYANVAVADGASAVYYNPAGLIQLKRPELNITLGSGRYKGFMCYAQPINERSAVGINFSYRKDENSFLDGADLNTFWVKAGYSAKLTEKLSVGANLTFTRDYRDGDIINWINEDEKFNTYLNTDFGILYKPNKKVNLGLLLQGYGFEAYDIKKKISVRPGVAIELNDNSFFAVDGYDITNEGNSRSVNLGLEKKVNDRWSIRSGLMFGIPSGVEVLGVEMAGNLGFSYRKGDLETSVALAEKAPFLILGVTKKF